MRDSYGSYVIEESSVADRSMNIILDFGMKFSKVGFAGEIEPRKILRTPSLYDNDKFLNDSAKAKIANYERLQLQNSENTNTDLNPSIVIILHLYIYKYLYLYKNFIFYLFFRK
jgi:hypothetical protein